MLQLLQTYPTLLLFVCLLSGLAIGSFLNVVIHRLPKMMEAEWQAQAAELRGEALASSPRYDLAVPRSRCPACNHAIRVTENIPLFSWMILRGRCSACRTRISARYLARASSTRPSRQSLRPARW